MMQAICTKCKGTGKVPAPVTPSSSQVPPAEPVLITCPACLGGGIIDTTAMA